MVQPSVKLPKSLTEMIKFVHMAKWSLIKSRQEQNRSYKEICIPVLEKCRFLLYEVKPSISVEMEAFKKINILYREPRVKTLVKKVIKDLKCGSHTSEIQKPEDIVNATIQSQSIERNKSNEDLTRMSMKKCSSDTKIQDSKSDTDDVNNVIKNGSSECRAMTESFNSNTSKHCTTPKNCMDLKTELEEKWNIEKLENESRDEQMEEEKQKKMENEIGLCSLLCKLTEKQMKRLSNDNLDLISAILEFVLQNNSCDVEMLRKAMYCQVRLHCFFV